MVTIDGTDIGAALARLGKAWGWMVACGALSVLVRQPKPMASKAVA